MYLAEKTGKLMPKSGDGALPGDRVADVADGRPRPDARPGPSLREVQSRARRPTPRSATSRKRTALRRARPPARRPRIRRRRVFDRRHRDLAVDLALRMADHRPQRLPNVNAGTSRSPSAGGAARLQSAERRRPDSDAVKLRSTEQRAIVCTRKGRAQRADG